MDIPKQPNNLRRCRLPTSEMNPVRQDRARRRTFVACVLLVIAVLGMWLWPKFYWWLTVDSCLDQGGSWNEQTRECEGGRP